MNKKILGTVCLILLFAEVLLVIVSWLLSATMMEGVRSLLSSEGIRWLFGSFTSIMASPLLVWLILLLSALGCLQKSGVMMLFGRQPSCSYREKTALRVAMIFLVIYLVIVALLTLPPHAILLSATGELFPSAFSRSLVPIATFGISLFSVAYGMMAGVLKSLSCILEALSSGISKGAPLIIILMVLILLRESLRFVFV
ncbi:MAG: AbgT family transporter [Prevotella sp.]|nr:AbgT family transporter [Prevotella sp.]MBR0166059.1 AbgT family transporter [Prevotella sp.]